MRCPDCNKFVSFDDPEVELQDEQVDEYEYQAEVRIALCCLECGTELKEATVDILEQFDHDCEGAPDAEDGKPDEDLEAEEDGFEIDGDVEIDTYDRYEQTDRHGKPIKNPRYQKHYYGVEVTAQVKCLKCQEVFEVKGSAERAASEFEELV